MEKEIHKRMKRFIKNTYIFLLLLLPMLGQAQGKIKTGSVRLSFNDICISPTFNKFSVTFEWEGTAATGSNEFVVELSSPTGDWSAPVRITSKKGTGVTSGGRINKIDDLKLPETVNGTGYKIRVRSTNPASEGESDSVSAFYSATTPLVLNERKPVKLCTGETASISVDNKNASAYKWYKDGVLIAGQTSHTISISDAGQYEVEIDAGNCSSNTKSNPVVASFSTRAVPLAISGTTLVQICQGQAHTLTANVNEAGSYYIWYKDNVAISEGNGKHTYTLPTTGDVSGRYKVQIGNNATCNELSAEITVGYRGSFTASVAVSDNNTMLLPGKSRTLKATASVSGNYTYKWFKDGVAQSGTTEEFVANAPGVYHAEVTQVSDCSQTKETPKVTLSYPAKFHFHIAYQNSGYQDCQFETTNLLVSKIEAESVSGERIALGNADYDFFTFDWKRNGASVGITTKVIELTRASQNGDYSVSATLQNFTGTMVPSTTLPIQLVDTEFLKLNNGDSVVTICAGQSTTLRASEIDATAQYNWYKETQLITTASGVGRDTYTTNVPGFYYVELVKAGTPCPFKSKGVRVQTEDFSAEFTDPDAVIYNVNRPTVIEIRISPENSQVNIEWYKDDVLIAGETTKTLMVTDRGAYHAVVRQIGGCGTTRSINKKFVESPVRYMLEITSCQEDVMGSRVGISKFEAELTNGETTTISPADYEFYNFVWERNGREISEEERFKPTGNYVNLLYYTDPNPILNFRLRASDGVLTTSSNIVTVRHNAILVNNESVEVMINPLYLDGEMRLVLAPYANKPLILQPQIIDETKYDYSWDFTSIDGDQRLGIHDGPVLQVSRDLGPQDEDTFYNALGTYTLRTIEKNNALCVGIKKITFLQRTVDRLSFDEIPENPESYSEKQRITDPDPIFSVDIIEGMGTEVSFISESDFVVIRPIVSDRPSATVTPEWQQIEHEYCGNDDGTKPFFARDCIRKVYLYGPCQDDENMTEEECQERWNDWQKKFAKAGIVREQNGLIQDFKLMQVGTYELLFKVEYVNMSNVYNVIPKDYRIVINVTAKEINDIPNVVLLKSKVHNDLWLLPQEYMGASVKIYTESGEVIYESKVYDGTWPDKKTIRRTKENPGRAMIYYYVITPEEGEEKRGTVTILD